MIEKFSHFRGILNEIPGMKSERSIYHRVVHALILTKILNFFLKKVHNKFSSATIDKNCLLAPKKKMVRMYVWRCVNTECAIPGKKGNY